MDFEFTEEQRILRESVDRLLNDQYSFEARRAYAKEPQGFSRELWRHYAEMGLLGLRIAHHHGGSATSPVEVMITAEAFGRALVLEPFVATAVLGGGLLRYAGNPQQCDHWLPKIADGTQILAFAHAERQSRYVLADVAATARLDGSSWIIDGAKTLVLHGDSADAVITSARISGAPRDRDGIGLFLVDAKSPGISRRGYPTIDGQRAADIVFSAVKVAPEAVLGEPGKALPTIERVVDEAVAALAAEAVGAMAAMHQLTVDYLKMRRQFGVPIGQFQSLQHKVVDMLIALEQARSMAMLATMMVDERDADERHRIMAAAKVQIGRSGRLIGQQAVQLHGGIGMTMEYKVGHYFKRVTAIDTLFGDADHHLTALARGGGLIPAV